MITETAGLCCEDFVGLGLTIEEIATKREISVSLVARIIGDYHKGPAINMSITTTDNSLNDLIDSHEDYFEFKRFAAKNFVARKLSQNKFNVVKTANLIKITRSRVHKIISIEELKELRKH